jgi:PKD repeat protein
MKTGTRIAISFFIALLLLCAITTANPEIIAAHNVYRNEVGVAPLTYSSSLATSAQTWADHDASIGSLVHSSSSYGENIASGMPTGSLSWTGVVNLWGAEKSYFIYGPLGNECSTTGHWYDIGHYTQIVWSTTTQCGCGKATNVTQNTEYFVCQYSPPGNFWGDYPYPQIVPLPVASFTVNTTSGTAPLAVTFTDTSTGTGITAWNWSFGDGTWENRTSRTSPIHTYNAGTWYPTLKVRNSSGSNTSLIAPTRTITVLPALMVLTVSASPPAVIAGTPTNVNFTVRNQSPGFVVVGAIVTLTGVATGSNTTGADGNATISVNAGSAGTITATASMTGYASGTTTILVIPATLTVPTKIGVYQNGAWYLDRSGNGAWDNGVDYVYSFGAPEWIPLLGDWSATGTSYIGVTNGQQWYLDWNGNGAWDGADKAYAFGAPGWTNVIGDWNHDRKTEIGVTNGQQWYLDNDGSGTWNVGDKAYSFGAPGWTPIIGDWNATGYSFIGVTNGQQWYLDWNGNGVWEGTDKAYSFGAPGWTPITGDWNHDGKTKIGVTNGQQWYLDWNGNGAFDIGIDNASNFGAPGWTPIVGNWNGTGYSYIGVTNSQQWYLDWNGNGAFDGGDKAYSFGALGWTPVVGKWT